MNMEKSKQILLKLNNLQENKDDFTLINVTFIIMDEFLSRNKQVMQKDVLTSALPSLKDKPIVVKYYKVSEINAEDDALGDHEEFIDIDKEGNEFINTDTTIIGHFTTEGYFADYNGKEVAMCDGVLNADRFPDLISLLKEWFNNGIQINSSVEYYYCNYEKKDGIEYIKSPVIFNGHCILNSEQRGNHDVIYGAYKDSQLLSFNQKKSWNKAISQHIKENNKQKKECNNMSDNRFLKALNDISFGEIRNKLYEALSKVMVADEYFNVYISSYDVYDNYFVYENYENDEWVNYKVTYTKTENDEIVIDYEHRQKASFETEWVAVADYETSQNSLVEANEKIVTLGKQLNEKDKSIKSLNSKLQEKSNNQVSADNFNKLTETITSLNAKVQEMQPIVDKYNQTKYEQSLNEQKEKFEQKFKSVNALDKFNSEEVQEMIKKSINDNSALMSLNAMVVDLIPDVSKNDDKNKLIKDFNTKKIENLIPKDNSFESRYMED